MSMCKNCFTSHKGRESWPLKCHGRKGRQVRDAIQEQSWRRIRFLLDCVDLSESPKIWRSQTVTASAKENDHRTWSMIRYFAPRLSLFSECGRDMPRSIDSLNPQKISLIDDNRHKMSTDWLKWKEVVSSVVLCKLGETGGGKMHPPRLLAIE
jgi:hypothetical protein